MPPAARLTDMHVCPMVMPTTPPVPHVGGPVISPGAPNVLIGGLVAARVSDQCICTGVGIPDPIVRGSATVLIGGLPAARVGDTTAHGGTIVMGCVTVLIGDSGASAPASGQGGAPASAARGQGGAPAPAGGGGVAGPSQGGTPGAPPPQMGDLLSSGAALQGPGGKGETQAAALRSASAGGAAFCEICNR